MYKFWHHLWWSLVLILLSGLLAGCDLVEQRTRRGPTAPHEAGLYAGFYAIASSSSAIGVYNGGSYFVVQVPAGRLEAASARQPAVPSSFVIVSALASCGTIASAASASTMASIVRPRVPSIPIPLPFESSGPAMFSDASSPGATPALSSTGTRRARASAKRLDGIPRFRA